MRRQSKQSSCLPMETTQLAPGMGTRTQKTYSVGGAWKCTPKISPGFYWAEEFQTNVLGKWRNFPMPDGVPGRPLLLQTLKDQEAAESSARCFSFSAMN